MSPKTKDDFTLPPKAGVRNLTIDGHKFTADFDDLELLRSLLSMSGKIQAVAATYDEKAQNVDEVTGALMDLIGEVRHVIERVLGDGAFEVLFDDKTPVMRSMSLVTFLAQEAGPVYDSMLSEYTAAPKE